MSIGTAELIDLKRRVRKLKRFEKAIRFNGEENPDASYVWDRYFDLHKVPTGKAKHTLDMLASMNREDYRILIDEFFAYVYYELYKEKGITETVTHDPSLLAELNLPFNADTIEVKKRFRELAKEHHPDAGGKPEKFIELMKIYEELLGR